MRTAEPTSKSSFLTAFFLASSWTWVIGMWLPVILVRHFGWPGWVAFAVPNVAGAMSVGLIYKARAHSEAFVARRVVTMRWFSKVTLALHAFVLTWALLWVFDAVVHFAGLPASVAGTSIPLATVLALAALVALWLSAAWFGSRSFRAACMAGAAVWALSVCLLGLAWSTNPASDAPQTSGDARIVDLLFLAPVLVFGFALCPYLDLTIHRARQETPGLAGDRAFVLGYGVLFLAMVAGTLLYAQGWIDDRSLSLYVAAHLCAQSWFTIAMHVRALRDTAPTPRQRPTATPLLVGIALGLAPSSALAIRLVSGTPLAGLLEFDGIYRVFMACYGLVFPGLLWAWTAGRRDDRVATVVAALAIVAAIPFFWLGFLEGRWFFLVPGLLIVLLSGPLIARGLPTNRGHASEQNAG